MHSGGKFVWLIVCAVWAGPMLAQTGATATLLGAVTDPSGAVVAGAAVTATNSETRLARSAVSDSEGNYYYLLAAHRPL